MSFMEDLAYAAENTAKKVGKKASEFADSSKKAVETAALKEKLAKEYEKLGHIVAENDAIAASVKLADEKAADVFAKISELKSELEKKSRNTVKCSCGKTVSKSAHYCSNCGKKIEK